MYTWPRFMSGWADERSRDPQRPALYAVDEALNDPSARMIVQMEHPGGPFVASPASSPAPHELPHRCRAGRAHRSGAGRLGHDVAGIARLHAEGGGGGGK